MDHRQPETAESETVDKGGPLESKVFRGMEKLEWLQIIVINAPCQSFPMLLQKFNYPERYLQIFNYTKNLCWNMVCSAAIALVALAIPGTLCLSHTVYMRSWPKSERRGKARRMGCCLQNLALGPGMFLNFQNLRLLSCKYPSLFAWKFSDQIVFPLNVFKTCA